MRFYKQKQKNKKKSKKNPNKSHLIWNPPSLDDCNLGYYHHHHFCLISQSTMITSCQQRNNISKPPHSKATLSNQYSLPLTLTVVSTENYIGRHKLILWKISTAISIKYRILATFSINKKINSLNLKI
jgi:hypothetical protein